MQQFTEIEGSFAVKFVGFWASSERDLAASKTTTSAFTAGVRLSFSGGVYYVEHAVRERETPAGVKRLIKTTADADGHSVRISIPQDPGQASKGQVI